LEGTDADHVPRDALRGREDDALRVRISHQPGADPILRIDREIGETGKFVSQPMRNRGFVFLFEKEVLLPAHRLDVFDVRLVGLSRHWKFDNARDGYTAAATLNRCSDSHWSAGPSECRTSVR